MKKILSILMVAILALVLGCQVGCVPALNSTAQMWDAADPVSKAVFFNEVYTEQWDQYIKVVSYAVNLTPDEVKVMAKLDPVKLKGLVDSSELTDEAKKTLRHKKAILKKVETPIDIFTDIANAGLAPTVEQEEFIVNLLNELKYKAYMAQ